MMMLKVDTAVVVPVNVAPLIDATDFKTIEDSVAYDAAGMSLKWNFVSTAGVVTQVAVTPTTGGVYDWSNLGGGMYAVEIPASAGASANNDTEGYGYFTGSATGVLPWRGPNITFAPAHVVDGLVSGSDQLQVKTARVLERTTIATLATQTSFTLTAGSEDNDAYNGALAVIEDASTAVQKAQVAISDYVGSTKTVTLVAAAPFTVAAGDRITILAENLTGTTVGLIDGAITDAKFTVPAVSGVATGIVGKIDQLWRRFFKRATQTDSQIITYADDGSTAVTTQTVSDDGTTEVQGAAS